MKVFFPHTENMQIEPPKNFREDFFMQKKLILYAGTDFLITFFWKNQKKLLEQSAVQTMNTRIEPRLSVV